MIFKSNKVIDLINNKEVVLFGAGIISKYYVELYDINVKYYVDNNPAKWGTEYLGKKIVNPNLLANDKDNIIVFIGSQYIDEISKQLSEMNFKKGVNYFIPRDLEEESIIEEAGEYIDNDEGKQRILLDMSQLALTDNAPGISRVVKNLVEAAYSQNFYEVVAVQRVGDFLFEPAQWLNKNKIKMNTTDHLWNKISYKKDDILLLPDAIWGQYDKFEKVINDIKNSGGKVINIIHDIIPIEHPDRCDRFIVRNYKFMLLEVLEKNDGIIAISRTVADKIISFIGNESIKVKENFKIGWFHNGFDKNNFLDRDINSENIKSIMNKKPFIIVGTIEPRKGHETAIDAFEGMWKNNNDVTLCIIGKVGWNVENLVKRIKNHKEFGKRLFFIEYPSDEELAYCYRNAEALIFPSIDEGFGLPLIEAASYKLPLILSDILIFRELAGENAIYFECKNSTQLQVALKEYNDLKEENVLPKSEKIKINTWKDSFDDIIKVIYGDNWYKEY